MKYYSSLGCLRFDAFFQWPENKATANCRSVPNFPQLSFLAIENNAKHYYRHWLYGQAGRSWLQARATSNISRRIERCFGIIMYGMVETNMRNQICLCCKFILIFKLGYHNSLPSLFINTCTCTERSCQSLNFICVYPDSIYIYIYIYIYMDWCN